MTTDDRTVWEGYGWDGSLKPLTLLWDKWDGKGFFVLYEEDSHDMRDDLDDEHDISNAYDGFFATVTDFKNNVNFDLLSLMRRWRARHE